MLDKYFDYSIYNYKYLHKKNQLVLEAFASIPRRFKDVSNFHANRVVFIR